LGGDCGLITIAPGYSEGKSKHFGSQSTDLAHGPGNGRQLTQAKVPVVIMNAGTSFITNMSPNLARVSFTMWQAGFIMGEHAAKNLNCKTAVAGFPNYPPGKDSVAAFKRGLDGAGGKLADAIPMGGPAKGPDFTPFLQRAKDKKPDCFYVFVPGGNHAAAVVRAYKQLGMKEAGIKLIGPGDITQDTKLQDMGKGAVGMITMHHYAADYDNPQNQEFVAAWKAAYGEDSTPDFMAVGGWDGMAAIAHAISAQDGEVTADGTMAALKGWTFASPRGQITIDADTRDIVMDVNVHKVVEDGDRLRIEVLETVPQVKDACKALKIGKCGE